jgi:hypothetical protein
MMDVALLTLCEIFNVVLLNQKESINMLISLALIMATLLLASGGVKWAKENKGVSSTRFADYDLKNNSRSSLSHAEQPTITTSVCDNQAY